MKKTFGGRYNGKRVLVTGHTGFKGSWLCLWLKHLGAQVCGFSLAPATEPNHFSLLGLEMQSHIDSIVNRDALSAALHSFKPDIVFHLAAQPLVRYSYEHPYETYETNVLGTLSVCDAARSCESVKAIVAITTDKVYENNEWVWGYREQDRLGGYDPYSSSKACAEILLASYRRSFLNPVDYGKRHHVLLSSVRAGNVIGGGDWSKDRLIPDIMKAAAAKTAAVIRNPGATRPWQHVLECLSGYLRVGQLLLEGQTEIANAYNFGPTESDELPVRALCDMIKAQWPAVQFEFPRLAGQPHEAGMLRLDCSKARSKLSWKPLWDSSAAIASTVAWYRDYYEQGSVNSESDLEKYCHEAKQRGAVWA